MASTGPAVFPSQPVTTTFAGLYPGTAAVPGASEFSGDAITPTSTLYPGVTTFPGQGLGPLARCRISFDAVSVSTPTYFEVPNSKFLGFSSSRGRDSEQSTIEAGTGMAMFDNRDRAYDSNVNAGIRPLNRVWLYEEFAGEVHDIIKGYAESWDLQWPDGGWSNATATVNIVDEFKVLALDALPTTSPVRSSYEDLVSSDDPGAYWRLNDDPTVQVQTPSFAEPNPVVSDPGSVPGSSSGGGGFGLEDVFGGIWRRR
jgi:hypothetical protein